MFVVEIKNDSGEVVASFDLREAYAKCHQHVSKLYPYIVASRHYMARTRAVALLADDLRDTLHDLTIEGKPADLERPRDG